MCLFLFSCCIRAFGLVWGVGVGSGVILMGGGWWGVALRRVWKELAGFE